ncbi:alpha/beta fold hydrolase [Candidatus Mycolicibacterium alkanivorans]|uniref:Alpha/beta hydrolase n=1 Tax=Candidatus Mycolicibacterium alkanivorans TaxID=2954114 RepID=A0ABS9YTB7_9MYCO|nr:alpha/beta hydrolase [Candidatus Mycolicibacterium alkanivorans]MCI4674074.1 alpha/beta hydrolase [Candidatus Mycolicibacterium alkanivorans]
MKPDGGADIGDVIRLADGRTIGYVEYGDRDGRALLYFHGHPGSRLEAELLAPAAEDGGIRLLGVDRPGMGLSSYQPRRQLLDWPTDVAELADRLGIDRFSVVGVSGGGPHAAACAYRIPGRLNACGLVSTVGHLNPTMALLARTMPWVATPLTRGLFADAKRGQRWLRRFAHRWVEPDRQALDQPGVAELMAATLAEAFRQGARGPAHEGTLFGRPWGFTMRQIGLPRIYLWHGELDRAIPVSAAHAIADELPHCEATYYPHDGHISLIVNHSGELMAAFE